MPVLYALSAPELLPRPAGDAGLCQPRLDRLLTGGAAEDKALAGALMAHGSTLRARRLLACCRRGAEKGFRQLLSVSMAFGGSCGPAASLWMYFN